MLVVPSTLLVPSDGTRAQDVNLQTVYPPVGIVYRLLIDTDAVVMVPLEYFLL